MSRIIEITLGVLKRFDKQEKIKVMVDGFNDEHIQANSSKRMQITICTHL